MITGRFIVQFDRESGATGKPWNYACYFWPGGPFAPPIPAGWVEVVPEAPPAPSPEPPPKRCHHERAVERGAGIVVCELPAGHPGCHRVTFSW